MSKVVEQLLLEMRNQSAAQLDLLAMIASAQAAGEGGGGPGPAAIDDRLATIFGRLVTAVEELTDAQKAAAEAERSAAEKAATRAGAVSDLRANAGGIPGGRAAVNIGDSIGNAGSLLGKAGSTIGSEGLGSAAGMASAGAALGALGGVASAVASAMGEVISSSMKFVDALSPGTVEAYQQVMRDLQATVGQALVPVIETASNVMREFGERINPIMQELRPAVEAVMGAFEGVASVVIDVLAEAFENLMPVIGALVPVVEVLGSLLETVGEWVGAMLAVLKPAFDVIAAVIKVVAGVLDAVMLPLKMFGDYCRAVGVVLSALFEAISAAFGSGLGDGMKSLKDATQQAREAFQEIIKAAVVLVAHFAKMSGMDEFVKKLSAGLHGKKQPIAGMAAAKNAQITDYASFGKAASVAAFTASGQLGEKKDKKDWLEEIAKTVEAISLDKNHTTWSDIIANGIRKAAADKGKDVVNRLPGEILKGVSMGNPLTAAAYFSTRQTIDLYNGRETATRGAGSAADK